MSYSANSNFRENDMTKEKKNWWENRVLRSVDNLKLWSENPRLDPSNKLSQLRDFVEDLISDPADEQDFMDLVRSISTQGFKSFDPIVVWKNENNDFVVAEGNRRVMALKLLRSPTQSPMKIRKSIVNLSRKIDRDEFEKIRVCVAPSYLDARWYILQRHSPASDQKRWERLQQQRFIISVYDSVGQDIEETINQTGFKRSTIITALRFVKLRDIATRLEITKYLTEQEKEKIFSHRINMTVLERWFSNSQIKALWHIDFIDDDVVIKADMNTFYAAYAKFLKLMLSKNTELGFSINTRTIDSNFDDILRAMPTVKPANDSSEQPNDIQVNPASIQTIHPSVLSSGSSATNSNKDDNVETKVPLKGDPKRRNLTDVYHAISVRSFKLEELFKELQKLPVHRYKNVTAASLRVFLELSVDEFIKTNELNDEFSKLERKGFHDITLSQKLSRLRTNFITDKDAIKVIDQLLHNSNDHSINTLNEYVHGVKIHKVDAQFLNRFWDMLTPLLFILISFREI